LEGSSLGCTVDSTEKKRFYQGKFWHLELSSSELTNWHHLQNYLEKNENAATLRRRKNTKENVGQRKKGNIFY
jgi:hypothetical protein